MLKFTRKAAITLPVMKLNIDQPAYLRFDSEMKEGKQLADQKEPATLMNATNLETGEAVQIVVPKVLHGILDDNFEGAEYVGRSFELIKGKMPSGKKYHPFTLVEIEVEAEPEEKAPKAAKK